MPRENIENRVTDCHKIDSTFKAILNKYYEVSNIDHQNHLTIDNFETNKKATEQMN